MSRKDPNVPDAYCRPEEAERIVVPVSEQIILPREQFLMILEECRHRCGAGFPKKYRELTTGEFCREVMEYMEQIEWIQKDGNEIKIRSIAGKITGRYPKDFNGEEGGSSAWLQIFRNRSRREAAYSRPENKIPVHHNTRIQSDQPD